MYQAHSHHINSFCWPITYFLNSFNCIFSLSVFLELLPLQHDNCYMSHKNKNSERRKRDCQTDGRTNRRWIKNNKKVKKYNWSKNLQKSRAYCSNVTQQWSIWTHITECPQSYIHMLYIFKKSIYLWIPEYDFYDWQYIDFHTKVKL